jgi:hypothetical protein
MEEGGGVEKDRGSNTKTAAAHEHAAGSKLCDVAERHFPISCGSRRNIETSTKPIAFSDAVSRSALKIYIQ